MITAFYITSGAGPVPDPVVLESGGAVFGMMTLLRPAVPEGRRSGQIAGGRTSSSPSSLLLLFGNFEPTRCCSRRTSSKSGDVVALAFDATALGHDDSMTIDVPSSLEPLLMAEPEPQASFPWGREAWRRQMHDLPEVLETLDGLPDRVDRKIVGDVVQAELEAGRVLSAFIPAMVWGWGTTSGLGALRTRWVLTGVGERRASGEPVLPSVIDRLNAGALSVRSEGPVEAFRLMNNGGHIKYLGSSYFTKWLYFASAVAGPDDTSAAPILDDTIADWLNEEAQLKVNRAKTASYAEYLALLDCWGKKYGLTRVQVETAIFRLATGRG